VCSSDLVIQLEPEARELLRSGQVFQSDVPLNLKDIRTIRIIAGKQTLQRIDPPTASLTETQKPALGPALTNPQTNATRSVPATLNEKPAFPSPAPSSDTGGKSAAESSKPWLPLVVAWLVCSASLAAFVYLLWIHLELRGRYRKLLQSSLAVH
jgi:hypothetical protein